MGVEAERYFAIGQEVEYGIAQILDQVASPGPHTAQRQLTAPSILEIVATGITTGGTVTIPGTVNGATLSDPIVLAIDAGTQVVTGVETFQAVSLSANAITTGTVAGGTIEIRVSSQEFVDMMDENIVGDNDPLDSKDRVASRFFQYSAAGPYEIGGDLNLIAEPEGGFARLMKYAMGLVTTTVLGGAVKFTGAIAATFTMATTIVANQNGGDKRIRCVVTGTAVAGTVTIVGTVNGSADSEVLTLNAANSYTASTVKAFDGLDITPAAQSTTGLTAGTLTVQQGDAHQHVLKFGGSDCPSFFGRVGEDGVYQREVSGLVAENLDLVMKTGEWVTAKVGLLGRSELLQDIVTPAFSNLEPFNFAQSVVTRDGVTFPIVMEATFSLANNPAKDRRSLDGTRFRRKAPFQGGEATLTAKFLFCDYETSPGVVVTADENYRRFLGNPTASSPQDTLDDWAMNLLFDSAIPIYSGGENYSINLNLPNLVPGKMDQPIKTRDVIDVSAEFKVKNTPGSAGPFILTIVNGQTEI